MCAIARTFSAIRVEAARRSRLGPRSRTPVWRGGASSGVGEVSRERPDLDGGHGVFTYAVLQALRGAADANQDALITASELFSMVHRQVRELTGGRQNPEALPGHNTDLPLVRLAGCVSRTP